MLLGSVVISGAYIKRLEIHQAYYPLREVQFIAAAKAGLELVKKELLKDNNEYDSASEEWSILPQGNEIDINGIQVNISVRDEESKHNLNTASPAVLNELFAFVDSANTEIMLDSLLDWIDTDSVEKTNGAEEEYYANLDKPHKCKDNPLDFVEELYLIRGFENKDS